MSLRQTDPADGSGATKTAVVSMPARRRKVKYFGAPSRVQAFVTNNEKAALRRPFCVVETSRFENFIASRIACADVLCGNPLSYVRLHAHPA